MSGDKDNTATSMKENEVGSIKKKVKRRRIISDSDSEGNENDAKETKPVSIDADSGFYICPFCSFSNQSSGKVYSHMEKVHGVKTFVCDFCKFTTKNQISMYNHTMKYCRKLRMMEKMEKDKDMKTKKGLTPIYVPDRNGGAKKYKCTECTFLAGVVGLFTNTCQRYIRWQNFVVLTVNSQPGTKHSCTIIELGTVEN